MNLLYNTGIRAYALGAKVFALRNAKANRMIKGQKQTMDRLRQALQPGKKYVWVHAASLGEFEQGRPFIERLRREKPEYGVVLTFFSPSGYEVRRNYAGADVVCYLPFDTPRRAKKFIETVNPAMAVFVKYEFWGNYLKELKRRNIPTYIISAIFRPTQPFFKWWGGMFRQMLACYRTIFVQDSRSAQLLSSIGVRNNVIVAGDTRFDRVTDILNATVEMPAVEKFTAGAPLTIVFGSSWPQDEELYAPWLKAHPEVKAIIAPHEFDEGRLEALRHTGAGKGVMLSELDADADACKDAQVLVVNCFGKLSSLYRYGQVAYVGGGFGEGIHNVNEAAVYAMPVLFGPKHKKFKEATDLIACGGGFTFTNRAELEALLDMMLEDGGKRMSAGAKAGEYIERNLGATDKAFKEIFGTSSKF